MNNIISIIVPIYNSSPWLAQCLDSIINQSYGSLEIICINDGSTDNSLDIIRRYANNDSRIIVEGKPNGGVSSARNLGLSKATGKYIMFVDSDDWADTDMCRILINLIESKDADLAVCGLNIYKNNLLLRTPNIGDVDLQINELSEYLLLRRINCGPCNKIYKKDLIKALFIEDMTNGEDLVFNIEYLKNVGKVVATKQCLYNVRLDNDNSLNRKVNYKKLYSFIKANNLENKFIKARFAENTIKIEDEKINACISMMISYRMTVSKKIFIHSIQELSMSTDYINVFNNNLYYNGKFKLLYKQLVKGKYKTLSIYAKIYGLMRKVVRLVK